MGVLNVTPDSFSDGGRFSIPRSLSSRRNGWSRRVPTSSTSARIDPSLWRHAVPVPIEEEIRRLAPRSQRAWRCIPVSIDTMKAGGGLGARASGAAIVNDVGLQRDGDLARVVAEHACL